MSASGVVPTRHRVGDAVALRVRCRDRQRPPARCRCRLPIVHPAGPQPTASTPEPHPTSSTRASDRPSRMARRTARIDSTVVGWSPAPNVAPGSMTTTVTSGRRARRRTLVRVNHAGTMTRSGSIHVGVGVRAPRVGDRLVDLDESPRAQTVGERARQRSLDVVAIVAERRPQLDRRQSSRSRSSIATTPSDHNAIGGELDVRRSNGDDQPQHHRTADVSRCAASIRGTASFA